MGEQRIPDKLADVALNRIVGAAFMDKNARPKFSIPVQANDDDVLLVEYIEQMRAENRQLKEELEAEWEASGKAARLNAELQAQLTQSQAKAGLADEAMRGCDTVKVLAEWLHGFLQQQAIHAHPSIFSQCPHITCTRWRDWLARYDALSSPTPEPEGVTDD